MPDFIKREQILLKRTVFLATKIQVIRINREATVQSSVPYMVYINRIDRQQLLLSLEVHIFLTQ